MQRSSIRITLVLVLLFLAFLVPVVSSGYSELDKASTASSFVEIAQHYKTAALRIPWRPDLYEYAGHAYYHAKEYSSAETMYQKAFEHRILSSDGWVAWGDVAYLNNDPKGATRIWQDGLEQQNASDQLYLRLAKISQENGDFLSTSDYFQKYLSTHPDDASIHYRLGVLLTLSDAEKALTELITASQLDTHYDPAVQTLRTTLNLASLGESPSVRLVIIGRGLGLVNEWRVGFVAFDEAVKADEKNAEAWAWLGEARQQTGQAGAEFDLDSALGLDPNSSIVRGLRGLYFQRTGNYRQALTEFQSAARLEPENPAWFVSLGDSYAKTGDLIRALEAYRYATTLVPDNAEYWLLLATFCAENNININDVGLPAAQKAVILTKDAPAELDVLGWVLLLNARYDDAEKILLRALEADPKNASAHFHLAIVYLQMNDRASAYDHLIRAHDLGSAEAETMLKQYFP